MGKRRDRVSPYNTSLSMPPPRGGGGVGACGPKKPWKLGPFRRGQWLSLDPPCGSVIEYNVCIVYGVFYLLRCPNFFVQRERWRIDFLCILGKGFILFGYSGLLIFDGKKKQNFAGFSGANSQKNRPISQDFRGRKVKLRWKIVWFRGILAEKVKFRRIFRGKFLEKSANFTGNFGGNFAKKQSVKNSRFHWIFLGKFR